MLVGLTSKVYTSVFHVYIYTYAYLWWIAIYRTNKRDVLPILSWYVYPIASMYGIIYLHLP